jgi:class 3 adenylate cyclase
LQAQAALALLAHETNDKAMAEELLPSLVTGDTYAMGVLPQSDHLRGLVLETLERVDEAVDAIEKGLVWLPAAYRPHRAEAAYDCARLRLERDAPGDRERARALIDEALGYARTLTMRPLVDKLVALKLQDQGISTVTDIYTSIDAVADSVGRERPEIPAHAAPDGTVTIMFSDIEDSTVLTERLGDQAWQELLHGHNALIREQLKVHDGYEVKTMGDGFMVAFQSSKKGLDCAIAIQRAFAGQNTENGERVKVRIGLHAGEAIKDGDDFYGKNVIVASRVAGQAKGGEILVSSLVRALVESSVGSEMFASPREVELKGLSGMHTVYEVGWT